MSTRAPSSIGERLNAAKIAILNSISDPEIQSLVSEYGYSEAKLNEGRTLYEHAFTMVSAQRSAEGAQKESTQHATRTETIARDAYQALAKVARAIYKDDKAQLTRMGLQGTTPVAKAEFLAAAALLFDNATGASELVNYGYTETKITSERSKIIEFDEANQKQEAAKGTAQNATREQDNALTKLDAWKAQYIKIAKVALRGKPQLMEKIGVIARTTKTAAQRAATRKKVPVS